MRRLVSFSAFDSCRDPRGESNRKPRQQAEDSASSIDWGVMQSENRARPKVHLKKTTANKRRSAFELIRSKTSKKEEAR